MTSKTVPRMGFTREHRVDEGGLRAAPVHRGRPFEGIPLMSGGLSPIGGVRACANSSMIRGPEGP